MNELFKEKFNKFGEKLKKLKNKEILIGLIILLIILAGYYAIGGKESENAGNIEFYEVEKKLENTLSQIKGVGKVNVMITYKDEEISVGGNKQESEKINGVIVVAKGGNNEQIKIEIIKATMTVLNIKANQIQVFVMK